MIGTIIGDIVGSPFERGSNGIINDVNWEPLFHPTLSKFTDDTVLTLATAEALLELNTSSVPLIPPFHEYYKKWATKYPNRGYGGMFSEWLKKEDGEINKSYSNGCMMRCSPIGILCANFPETAINFGRESIKYTHNSPESLRGVSAIITAMLMSFQKKTKQEIKSFIEENYGHWLDESVENVKKNWDKRNIRCNITCAQALICFLNSTDFESAIRLAVYSEGDCDTIAAICGSLSEAFYGVNSIPLWMIEEMKKRLEPEMISLINNFYYICADVNKEYKGFEI